MTFERLEEAAEIIRESESIWINGSGSKTMFSLARPKTGSVQLSTACYRGIVSHEVSDQVVVVRSGTTINELQSELAERYQCLPLPSVSDVGEIPAGVPGTVGGLLAMNLPHALEGRCGGARDWVLGCTIVRGDGTIAKSGSKAVKSVAGYDAHKLMIGARGTLGLIVDVILRVFPLRALPRPALTGEHDPANWSIASIEPGQQLLIQRTMRTDFDRALSQPVASRAIGDSDGSTIWFKLDAGDAVERFENDWMMSASRTGGTLEHRAEDADMMRRTQEALEPQRKFNRGAMGGL